MIRSFYCRANLHDSWDDCKSVNLLDHCTCNCSVHIAVRTPDSVLVPGNPEPKMMRDLPSAGHGKPNS